MKFLCPQCKAKYQISDDKIDGRTLRMKCRRCEHEIVVRGDGTAGVEPLPPAAPAAPPPGSSPGRLQSPKLGQPRTGSQVGPAPARKPSVRPSVRAPMPSSALGADFRRQSMQAPADPASHRPPPSALDQWHVSIQDVPVGPMKREELARKITAGAVTGDSLCWREGYDDWRPLKDIAELAPLLRRSAPPGMASPVRPGMPGVPPRPGQRPSISAPRPIPAPSRTPSSAGARPAPAGAAARSNVVPIGGRLGASAAPAVEDFGSFDDQEEPTRIAANPFDESMGAAARSPSSAGMDAPIVDHASFPPIVGASMPPAASSNDLLFASIPPAAPAPAAAPVMAPIAARVSAPASPSLPPVIVDRRRGGGGLPVGAWIAIVGAGCFGIALAVVIGSKLVIGDKPAQVVVTQAPIDNGPRLPEAQVDVNLQAPAPSTPTTPVAANNAQASAGGNTVRRPNTPAAPAAGGGNTQAAAPGRQLSAAEQAELDRMAGGATTFRPNTRTNNEDDAPRAGGAEMTAEQLRAVVNRERASSQHCYEMAARQSGSQDTMRVNVHFVTSPVGRVTEVTASGPVDALNRCMEAAIRRWHFSGAGEASLPFVFSPGN